MNFTLEGFLKALFQIVEAPLFSVAGTPWSLSSIFQLILSLIVVILLGRFLKKFLQEILLAKLKIEVATRETLAIILSYGGCTLGVLVVLDSQGFNIASLAVLAGGLGVGIGWGLQDITRNFVSGITLVVEKPIKIGDLVELEGVYGFVEEISLRSTRVRTVQGSHLVIPNGFLIGEKLHNLTYDNLQGRIEIEVLVPYDSDPVLVTEILLMSADMEVGVLQEPPPKVLFQGVGDSVLKFQLWVWIEPVTLFPYYMAGLRRTVLHNLKEHGINVPLPYRNLQFANPEVFPGKTLFTPGVKVQTENQENQEGVYQLPTQATGESENQLPTKERSQVFSARELLLQVSYFKNFTDLELQKLIEVGYRRRLKAADFLFREGDPGDAFYIILSGSVKIFVEKIDKHLKTIKAGDFLGELALMLGVPRTATAQALENTVVFGINKSGFEKALKENQELADDIVKELANHRQELSERQQQLREMGLLDPEDDENTIDWMRHRLKHLFHLE